MTDTTMKCSAISGEGYGRDHAWRYINTELRTSIYRCADCGIIFRHFYNIEPQIGKAMAIAGIPDKCVNAHGGDK